jgi:hypothetical protein
MNKTGGEFPFGGGVLWVFLFSLLCGVETRRSLRSGHGWRMCLWRWRTMRTRGLCRCPRFWEMEMIQNEICIGAPPLG